MKDVILLTKILLKGSSSQYRNSKKNKISIGKLLLFGLLYAYLAGIIGYISYEAIGSLIAIRQEAVFLNMCFMGILGFAIIQTVFNGLNILFFSKDIEYLLPLPVKPIKIVMAKINCLIITQYIISAIIVLPALMVYGYLLNLEIIFYVMGILVMLLFPIVPVILTTIIITIIMKFTNIIKNKDMVQYITVFLTLIFIIAIQVITGGASSEEITDEQLANMLVETNGMIELYSDYFITIKPTINSLLNYNSLEGLLNIGILIIETVFTYILGGLITSNMYIKAVTSITNNGSKKREKMNKNKAYKESSTLKSYVKKEFKNLVRNPIFFMQCILPSILFPIIFSMPIWVSFKDMGQEELQEFISIISNVETSRGLIVALGIGAFCFMFNFIALTAISRDRNNSVFMKYIPIGLEKQCFYKILPGIIMNMIPVIYFVVILKILIPAISAKILTYIIIDLSLINVFNNYVMIIIDLKNPKLEWITEYAVVKQNINMLFQIVIILIQMTIIAIIGINILNIDIFMIIVILIYIISIFLIRKYIIDNQIKLFRKVI